MLTENEYRKVVLPSKIGWADIWHKKREKLRLQNYAATNWACFVFLFSSPNFVGPEQRVYYLILSFIPISLALCESLTLWNQMCTFGLGRTTKFPCMKARKRAAICRASAEAKEISLAYPLQIFTYLWFFFHPNKYHWIYIILHVACGPTVELRNRAAALELERNATKFGPSLSRSRSAQSLKLLGDTATQVRKRLLYGFSCHY